MSEPFRENPKHNPRSVIIGDSLDDRNSRLEQTKYAVALENSMTLTPEQVEALKAKKAHIQIIRDEVKTFLDPLYAKMKSGTIKAYDIRATTLEFIDASNDKKEYLNQVVRYQASMTAGKSRNIENPEDKTVYYMLPIT